MNTAATQRPSTAEYAAFYEKYVSRVPETDLVHALASDREALLGLIRSIPESRAGHRYAPDKWSIREVFQHVADSERVFGFRAFWFARNGGAELPGFEQDDFIRASPGETSLSDLADELDHLRRSHLAFFEALGPDAWTRKGVASGNPISVRALAAIMVGHSRHHATILSERYGISA
jgi:hypothetical protein